MPVPCYIGNSWGNNLAAFLTQLALVNIVEKSEVAKLN